MKALLSLNDDQPVPAPRRQGEDEREGPLHHQPEQADQVAGHLVQGSRRPDREPAALASSRFRLNDGAGRRRPRLVPRRTACPKPSSSPPSARRSAAPARARSSTCARTTCSRSRSARPSRRCRSSTAAEIVDVMVGCGFPQEKQGMNLARRAALLAGLPAAVAGTTVNRFCASSLQTIAHGVPRDPGRGGRRVRRRRRRVDLAGGRLPEGRRGAAPEPDRRRRADRERLHPDGADRGERRRAVRTSRARTWTGSRSARRSAPSRPRTSGFFARELTPYTKADGTVVAADDGPRADSTLESASPRSSPSSSRAGR